jgi:hypothetical protein
MRCVFACCWHFLSLITLVCSVCVFVCIGLCVFVCVSVSVAVAVACAPAAGHTGDVATSILIPAVVDLCRGKKSSFTGRDVFVVAAGGIADGRGPWLLPGGVCVCVISV